ncbi:MAG: hypothetical protein FWF78_08095 [Defluviitaleaceae bacterium]|nr:hypothetical protein [Defluviitaleaceae bacterium]
MVERITNEKDEPPPPILCRMANFADGGMLFTANEDFIAGEKISLTFEIGTVETVDAEVLRFERADIEAQPQTKDEKQETHSYKVAVKFLHKCQKQKDRFYRYIIEQQREIIRRQAEENTLLKP